MPATTIAIVQSSYIPWKGYFDLIRFSDRFLILDDVQYTPRNWRNRNRIKTKEGLQWLTIPVNVDGDARLLIRDVQVAGGRWAREHWQRIRHAYTQAPHFDRYAEELERLYRECADEPLLGRVNRRFLEWICKQMGISTPLSWSWDTSDTTRQKSERLIDLCLAAGANRYLSGPAAKDYLEEDLFRKAGIAVSWMNYDGYPAYPQIHGPFAHPVSALDLLFHTGPDVRRYLSPAPPWIPR